MEATAKEARDVGNEALNKIATHMGACVEIQKSTRRDLDDIKGDIGELKETNRWQLRGIITTLLVIIGAAFLEIARAAHWFGG